MSLSVVYAANPLQFVFVIMFHTHGTAVTYLNLSMFRLCQNTLISDVILQFFTTLDLYNHSLLLHYLLF